MAELKNWDISGMLSDEVDLALTISQITVRPDKTLQFRFIDGRTLRTGMPKYSRKDDEVFMISDKQKQRIEMLRPRGYGYRKVADKLGLNMNSVKSYCQRNVSAGGKAGEDSGCLY